jgi:NADPH:quinone reductase-like Zn-dependent oxidoreductase
VTAIGLNPIDWKGPYVSPKHPVLSWIWIFIAATNNRSAFNFGIPSLPWVNGRDLAGIVVQTPETTSAAPSRLRKGDLVLVPSTDYRDIRKAAFQEYAVATHFNAARIPASSCAHAAASVGVAFVAAILALGISFGVDFSLIEQCPGPNLVDVLGKVDKGAIPADVRDECFASAEGVERPKKGDWIAIWGGMSQYPQPPLYPWYDMQCSNTAQQHQQQPAS